MGLTTPTSMDVETINQSLNHPAQLVGDKDPSPRQGPRHLKLFPEGPKRASGHQAPWETRPSIYLLTLRVYQGPSWLQQPLALGAVALTFHSC